MSSCVLVPLLPICELFQLLPQEIRNKWCQEWDCLAATMTTHATTKMEEQMAALVSKLVQQSATLREQNEEVQLLVQQQSERVDELICKQVMDERFSTLEGDLESIKTMVDGQLQVLKELVAGLRSLHSDLWSRDKSLKQELKEELLHEMGMPVHVGPETLCLRATLFHSSWGMVGKEEGGTERNDSEM